MNDNYIPCVGDIVWFDYVDRECVKGQIKKINSENSYAEIHVGKRGLGKVNKSLDKIYPSKQAYDKAKKAESERKQAEFYEQTKTVEGLLRFLNGREMICRGDASDDAWAVIQRRLKESGCS